MISQSEVDIGTTRTIGMPSLALVFDCGGFNIEDSSSKSEIFPYKTLFSPDLLKGREMITYSAYFEMPFKIDYFIYVTSKQVRYNFINSSTYTPQQRNLLSTIINELPANITYKIADSISKIKNDNYYKERFIIIGETVSITVTSFDLSLKDTDVSAIRIIPDTNNNQNTGRLTYYKKDSSSFASGISTNYLGIPMLLGAIISEESLYACNVNKTLQKYMVLSEIYSNRTSYLANYYSSFAPGTHGYDRCYRYYDDIISLFHTIIYALNSPNPFSGFSDIYSSSMAYGLKDKNEQLMLESCPMIY
jgi:hypothetical protein